MVKSRENLISAYAFLAGVVLAVIVGFFQSAPSELKNIFYILLVVLGLLVGFINTGDKDSITFLLASLALVIVGGLGNNTIMFIANLSPILSLLNTVLQALLVLFIPATIVVALKTVFSIAKV
jgi:hypothetical protein